MWEWIKKVRDRRRLKREWVALLKEHARLIEEGDEEYMDLLMLQDPICGKHHG